MLNVFIIFSLPRLLVLYGLAMFHIGCTILLNRGGYKMSGGFGLRSNFALIVVLFILLIIVGCSCFFGGFGGY